MWLCAILSKVSCMIRQWETLLLLWNIFSQKMTCFKVTFLTVWFSNKLWFHHQINLYFSLVYFMQSVCLQFTSMLLVYDIYCVKAGERVSWVQDKRYVIRCTDVKIEKSTYFFRFNWTMTSCKKGKIRINENIFSNVMLCHFIDTSQIHKDTDKKLVTLVHAA